MNYKYNKYPDAISDLKGNGYTEEFVLFGNNLLWVQRNICFRK